jgi:L-ascorbate metabolism protein UlaG (beta-lactamase superfamily)
LKGEKMGFELTFIGHATLGLETGGYKLLVDPYLRKNPVAKVDANTVEADYILVTHGHGDHIGDTVEIAQRTGATVVSNAEICRWLQEKGLKTHAQHLGGGFNYPFGYLKLTLALHGSCLPDGSDGGHPAGFLLTTNDGDKIYMAGDTGLFGDMRLIGEEGITLAVLPIGDNYTMGPADALRAVKMLTPQHVIPIHYNTFSLIAQDVDAWAELVHSETDAKVHALKPGECFVYP